MRTFSTIHKRFSFNGNPFNSLYLKKSVFNKQQIASSQFEPVSTFTLIASARYGERSSKTRTFRYCHNGKTYSRSNLFNRNFFYEFSHKSSKLIGALGACLASLVGFVVYRQLGQHVECEQKPLTEDREGEEFSLEDAIKKSKDFIQRIKDETGSPGLAISVAVDGQEVWSYGLGYADVENRLPCSGDTVWRIASISKSITMAAVAKQWEAGKLDLDKPIQDYLPKFPKKKFDGKEVTITTRQLVSHLSGIRHYDKDYMKKSADKAADKEKRSNSDKKPDEKPEKTKSAETNSAETAAKTSKNSESKESTKTSEFDLKEYYITKRYSSVTESLKIFQEDPLVHEPGSNFLYTTHGFTLLSAVLEAVAGKSFEALMKEMFSQMGLAHTYLDENDCIIYNRGRHYIKNKVGKLRNAPYVDNSYKWAGGGFLSSTRDVLKFGNIMLYSYQNRPYSTNQGQENSTKTTKDQVNTQRKYKVTNVPGYLKPETVDMLWTPVPKAVRNGNNYAMGWYVVPETYNYGECRRDRLSLSHTGGAVGASSILFILPRENRKTSKLLTATERSQQHYQPNKIPCGVVIAIIVNMGSVNLTNTASEIANLFDQID